MRVLTVELLGPLRVSASGRPVELPAGRLRALLAVLALSAGRAVETDRIVTTVWGNDSGTDPRGSVRTNVKRLRRALDDPEGALIAARPGGYLLAVEPDQVDALRFGRLLDRAAADPAAERPRLTAALELWRGAPFEGVRSDWLEGSVAPALEERRLKALERLVDLDLEAGRPVSVEAAELAGAAERHPLRESLWARLLRVLEATGRPAEALERYEEIRRRLAEELGVDPSTELRRVHTDLLAGGPPPEERAVPRLLPADVGGFAAREAELKTLDALLASPEAPESAGPRIAVVTGMAGIGKTSLAVHWAHRVADRFPDGQLYVDLRGYDPSGEPVRPEAAVRELLAGLQVPPNRIPDVAAAQAGLLRSLLSQRRMLLVIDNARDAEQVVPLLPGAPGCLAVVTSRDHLVGLLTAYGALPVVLEPLPPSEAGRLLTARLGPDRTAAEPQAAEAIVERCAGLPLALAIVAARAAIRPAHPLGSVAEQLREDSGALHSPDGVRAVFSWSYRALGGEAARMFRLFAGLHPGPDGSTAAAASLSGAAGPRVRASLAELTAANLLVEDAAGRYSCHDLLRAYAAELCESDRGERDTARGRVVEHCVHNALAAARRLHGYTDIAEVAAPEAPASPSPGVSVAEFEAPAEAMAWFAAERRTALAAMGLAAELGRDRDVCRLAWALSVPLHRLGRWHERADAQSAAVSAAERLGDDAEAARAHRNLALALADLGRFDEAHRGFDIALDRSRGDLAAQAWTHHHRDLVHLMEGRDAEALDAARLAHDRFEELGDEAGLAIALTNLGWHAGRRGDHEQALELCERALVLHRRLGNRPYEAHTLSCLAEIHVRRRDFEAAVSCGEAALGLFGEIGDWYGEAGTLAHLGASHRLAGDRESADRAWRRAHELLGELDPSALEQVLAHLATVDRPGADAFRVHRSA